jgi:hypothetical protein
MDTLYLKLHHPELRSLIQRIQQISDKDTHTFKDFQETGLMMPRRRFEKTMGGVKLRPSCNMVIWYMLNNAIIQGLDSGFFIADTENGHKRSKTLDVVEKFIYEQGSN